MKLTRTNAILHAKAVEGLSEQHIGCAVYYRVGGQGPEASPYHPDDNNRLNAVVLHVDQDTVTVAILHGGLAGTVLLKVVEEVSSGHELHAINAGGFLGFADADEQNHSGTFFKCAYALENAVAGEMIEAVLFRPESVTFA